MSCHRCQKIVSEEEPCCELEIYVDNKKQVVGLCSKCLYRFQIVNDQVVEHEGIHEEWDVKLHICKECFVVGVYDYGFGENALALLFTDGVCHKCTIKALEEKLEYCKQKLVCLC